jgi:hypothetical protein
MQDERLWGLSAVVDAGNAAGTARKAIGSHPLAPSSVCPGVTRVMEDKGSTVMSYRTTSGARRRTRWQDKTGQHLAAAAGTYIDVLTGKLMQAILPAAGR